MSDREDDTDANPSVPAPDRGAGAPARRGARNALAGMALALASLVLFYGAAELLARRAASSLPQRLAHANQLATPGLDEPDPDLFWRYRPNQDVEWKGIRVRTNAFGLRDRERTRAKPPAAFRILSLGESTTFGEKVAGEETYSYRLEEILNADAGLGRHVEVWNAGVSSYSTYQSLRWLERDGLALEPDLVLFYHEINDFLPTYHRTGDGHALGLGRSDRELGALRRRLGPLIGWLDASHFYRWLRIRVLLAASHALAPAPEREGVYQETADPRYHAALKLRLPWSTLPPGARFTQRWPDTPPYVENRNALCRVPDSDRLALLEELVRTLRARGIDLVLIHPAYKVSVPHRCVLSELAAREGIPLVELERIELEAGIPKSDAFLDIYHPSAELHRLLAEELARVVRPRVPRAS